MLQACLSIRDTYVGK